MATEDQKITIHGGCHCGYTQSPITFYDVETNQLTLHRYIKYSFDIDAGAELSANRCNCSFCQKLGTTNFHVTDKSSFKLLSPASTDDMASYAPRVKTLPRYFCDKCGGHVYMDGYFEHGSQKMEILTVSAGTIDQPQDGIDVKNIKIKYYDMLKDNFAAGTADEPYPCGLH